MAPGLVGPYTSGDYDSATATSGAQLIDYSVRFGKGFEITNALLLTPYLEIGHHQWKRNLSSIAPIKRLVLTADAMVGYTMSSSMAVSGYSPFVASIGGNFNGIYGLGNSAIYKLGSSADYAITETVHANIGINYTVFNYEQSAMAGPNSQTYEPSSKTNYLTFQVGLGYAF